MAKLQRIHKNKQPIRRHFLPEWLEAKGLEPMDLLKLLNDPDRPMELGEIEKSQVYRWIAGQMPGPANQKRIMGAMEEEPEALLRHPIIDEWAGEFFRDRDMDELQRMKTALEASFPKKEAG